MLSRWDYTPNLLRGFRLEGLAMACWRSIGYPHGILEAAAEPAARVWRELIFIIVFTNIIF